MNKINISFISTFVHRCIRDSCKFNKVRKIECLHNLGIGKNLHFFKKINLFIYLSIFGCVGSSFLCKGFLQLRRAGATLHRGARASHCRGLSRCGAQAPDAQAQ